MRNRAVTIELDKPRQMRLSFAAAADFEEQTGESLFDPMTFAKPTAKKLIALLWACLRAGGDSDITLEQVAEIVDVQDMPMIEAALSRLMREHLPPQGEELGKASKKRSTGTS